MFAFRHDLGRTLIDRAHVGAECGAGGLWESWGAAAQPPCVSRAKEGDLLRLCSSAVTQKKLCVCTEFWKGLGRASCKYSRQRAGRPVVGALHFYPASRRVVWLVLRSAIGLLAADVEAMGG